MKRLLFTSVAVGLLFAAPARLGGQSGPQLLQGSQIRLVLLNGLSTAVARDGDPFTAVVSEPVYLGDQMVLPAGAIVRGEVGNVQRPKHFALFRQPAAMNLTFRSIEVDHREVPIQMSIISIHETSAQFGGKARKDLRVGEGVQVESKYDIKRDLTAVGLATGGGTAVGAIFSHALRGLTIGLIGGTGYVISRKGKEVELPAHTGLLVRTDNTVTLPATPPSLAPHTGTSGQP
jgi:hypothetical protein